MPSFDVVSKVQWNEVDNALNQAGKEIGQRFDFKDTDTVLERTPEGISVRSESEDRVKVKEGIESEPAKKIVMKIKDAKLKVQASIQEAQVRVTGKNRDDLQGAIALVRQMDLPLELQFVNFRD